MNLDEFNKQIVAARQRTAALNQYARKSLVLQQELLIQAFEELYAALEDLELANEELCLQNEEIAAAHEVAEVERYRYHNMFEFAPDAYLVTDVGGIIREANYAAARLLNVSQHFLVGKPLTIFVSQEERRVFLTELARLCQCAQGQEWEVRLQPRNSAPIDATLTVTTVRHQEGKQISLGWILRDTTKRKQPELGLLSTAVQQANESIVLTSAKLDYPGPEFVFVNPAFTKMTAYTMEEVVGQTPRILQGPKTERSVLEQLRRSMSRGKLFCGEMINYRKDGTEYNVEMCCSPIQNERGEITHFISIQHDITHEK